MNGANVPELMKKLKMHASAADVGHTAPEQVMHNAHYILIIWLRGRLDNK